MLKKGHRLAVPTNLRLLRGDPSKGRALQNKNEPQPIIPDSVPEPPSPLEGYAADEWRRLAPELYRLKLITMADINTLATYCQCYKTWREATEMMNELSRNGAFMKGYVWEHRTGIVKNSLHTVAREAAIDMLRFANEFGLSPSSRSRISVPEARKANKFDGLISSEAHGGRQVPSAASN